SRCVESATHVVERRAAESMECFGAGISLAGTPRNEVGRSRVEEALELLIGIGANVVRRPQWSPKESPHTGAKAAGAHWLLALHRARREHSSERVGVLGEAPGLGAEVGTAGRGELVV